MRDVLAGIDRLPFGSLDQIAGTKPVIVLAPHPDDETLGCGGLMAAAHARGQHVEVVVLTDGSGSHKYSAAYPTERLVDLRRSEATAAVATLGLPPGRLTFLDLKDAAAPKSGPQFDLTVAAIRDIVRKLDAGAIFVTWPHDPHCDHEAAATMAAAVTSQVPGLRLWHYPIWGLHLAPEKEIDAFTPSGFRLDVSNLLARKRAAIACHASQMTDLIDDDPQGFHFTDETLAPFLQPVERFLEAAP